MHKKIIGVKGRKKSFQVTLIVLLLAILVFISSFSTGQTENTNDQPFDDCYVYPTMIFPEKTNEGNHGRLKYIPPSKNTDDIPSQFSWLSFNGNWLTPAKDQRGCGSAWAFSALGTLEAAINIASGNPDLDLDLSEQYVLSCLSAAGSCGGGLMSDALIFIKSTSTGPTGNGVNGVTIESCMPYQELDYIPCGDKCNDWDYLTDPPQPDNKLWQIKDCGVTTITPENPSDWEYLKSLLLTYGPLSVDLYASPGYMSYWSTHHNPSDVYQGTESGNTNHGQILCGWVDDASIYNGGYWILKNSWGQEWGYNGFNNLAYGCLNLGQNDVSWVQATPWPGSAQPPNYEMGVFADFKWYPRYPHPGEEIEFTDITMGDVVKWEWDFNNDGTIDSTEKNPSWSFNEEVNTEISLHVWSTWGLDDTRIYTFNVKENWPPVCVIRPESYADNELSISFDGRFSYDLEENGEIVSYQWDLGDGTTSDESHLTNTYSEGDSIYEVSLTVVDDQGDSDTNTCEVRIDQTVPPKTTIHQKHGNDNTTWSNFNLNIFFEATDWTSVINTFYRIDDPEGQWRTYRPNDDKYLLIHQEGMHTIEAYSVDFYGNEEPPVTRTIGIDKGRPTLDIILEGEENDGWYKGLVEVTLDGDDDLSGIDNIIYKINQDDEWKFYSKSFKISQPGPIRINCVVVDRAGNIIEKSTEFSIDPAPSIPIITGPSSGKKGVNHTFKFMSTDHFQDSISYFIDWGDGNSTGWTSYQSSGKSFMTSHSWEEKGFYEVKAKAKDEQNIESDWQYVTIELNKKLTVIDFMFDFLQWLLKDMFLLHSIPQFLF